MVYTYSMKMPLSKTNPFIKDPIERERLVTRSVIISSRIEGVEIDVDKLSGTSGITISRHPKKINQK